MIGGGVGRPFGPALFGREEPAEVVAERVFASADGIPCKGDEEGQRLPGVSR